MLRLSIMEKAVLQPASPANSPGARANLPLPELYRRVERHVPEFEWPVLAEDIAAILKLKRERNAVVLAHNYQTPDIFHTVADIVGDSLALAREAARTDADVIVLAGVHFMAGTAKLLHPEKTVLIPDTRAGCSLAESITAADVRLLRARHPGVPIVTYVNTSAAVKAESDICCTSGNAKKIIAWKGHCEVHERFTAADVQEMRANYPGVVVLAHPECPPEVVAECDFTGSTAAMADYVGQKRPGRVVLLTECSMSDNVALQYPDLDFVRPCNLCPHMKRITLGNIRHALETMTHEVTVAPEIAGPARRAVERMLELG